MVHNNQPTGAKDSLEVRGLNGGRRNYVGRDSTTNQYRKGKKQQVEITCTYPR